MDDVSRITAVKKTITKQKITKYRQPLCDMLKTLYIKFKAEIGASENKATHVNLTPICLKTVNFLSSLHSILRLATSTVIRLLSPFIRFRCISPQSPRENDSHQMASTGMAFGRHVDTLTIGRRRNTILSCHHPL